jgi:hypothetical protein
MSSSKSQEKTAEGWTVEQVRHLCNRRMNKLYGIFAVMAVALIYVMLMIGVGLINLLIFAPMALSGGAWPLLVIELIDRRSAYLMHVTQRRANLERLSVALPIVAIVIIISFVKPTALLVLFFLAVVASSPLMWLLERRFERRKPMSVVMAELGRPDNRPSDEQVAAAAVVALSSEAAEYMLAVRRARGTIISDAVQHFPPAIKTQLVAANLAVICAGDHFVFTKLGYRVQESGRKFAALRG